jgi:hypothetical protein
MSIDGSVCFFVLYHYELNAILVKPIANVDDRSIYEAYKEVFETLEAKEYKPKMKAKCFKHRDLGNLVFQYLALFSATF